MSCCKCKCSFKNCIEERKEALTKEFQQMVEKWMKEHPEVNRVWLYKTGFCSTQHISIYQNVDFDVTIHFE
jgi:hypothetical protein